MNNYERIKAMTLDEMAEFLDRKSNHECCYHHYNVSCIGHDCKDGIKQWLESESEEECQK